MMTKFFLSLLLGSSLFRPSFCQKQTCSAEAGTCSGPSYDGDMKPATMERNYQAYQNDYYPHNDIQDQRHLQYQHHQQHDYYNGQQHDYYHGQHQQHFQGQHQQQFQGQHYQQFQGQHHQQFQGQHHQQFQGQHNQQFQGQHNQQFQGQHEQYFQDPQQRFQGQHQQQLNDPYQQQFHGQQQQQFNDPNQQQFQDPYQQQFHDPYQQQFHGQHQQQFHGQHQQQFHGQHQQQFHDPYQQQFHDPYQQQFQGQHQQNIQDTQQPQFKGKYRGQPQKPTEKPRRNLQQQHFLHQQQHTCIDQDANCAVWASSGECTNSAAYMSQMCQMSCGLCSPHSNQGMNGMKMDVGIDLGVPQVTTAEDGTRKEDIEYIIQKARNYMQNVVPKQYGPDVAAMCRNENEFCALWAHMGQCEEFEGYMTTSCGPACNTCKAFSVESRCPINPNAPKAWGPGDLNKMFVKLTSEPYRSKYSVEILSSPFTTDGPWVITMDNLLSEHETQRMVDLGKQKGYERSVDVGAIKADGTYEKDTNDGRTSTNAWCDFECAEDEAVMNVVERFNNMTGIDDPNAENLQLLRYGVGQHYGVHHDYIPHQKDRPCGVRLLTVYAYLNDVEDGGGTNFDQLDITVMPKRGRVVIWPSVLDEDPNERDSRTTHQALPVKEGVKYGANAWFHMRDYKNPNMHGCS